MIIFMYRQIAFSETASKRFSGRLLVQAVDDPGLGRDEEAVLRRRRAKSIIPSVERMCVRPLPNAMHWLAQPHSGWTRSSASGRLFLPALDVARPDPGVDVALAHPDPERAAGHLLEPEAEVHVRQEQDLGVSRDRVDDRLRVAGRAAVVALGLHLGGRVHVRDDDSAGVLRLPGAELVGR